MPQLRLLSSVERSSNPMKNVPKIEVTFDDGTTDRMVLEHHNPLPDAKNWDPSTSCTYLGHMEADPLESKVAVTGCLGGGNKYNKMYITLLSKRSPYHKTFSIDEEGNVAHIKLEGRPRPYGQFMLREADGNWTIQGDEIVNQEQEKVAAALGNVKRGTVPFSVDVDIMVGYDRSARNAGNIITFLGNVITHVKARFQESTLEHHIHLRVSLCDFYTNLFSSSM